jgi:hypothetical protein
MGIAENLAEVRKRIRDSAIRAGRNPEGIKLVAVSKTVEVKRILEAVNAGVTILGENRVQEAAKKIQDLRFKIQDSKFEGQSSVEWHMVGHLQKNKAKVAVQLFDLIHSVDSVELAERLNKYALQIDKRQRILIQVKLSEEETKHGIPEKGLKELVERVQTLNYLNLEGLMTLPPYFEDPEKVRPYFQRLRELRDEMEGLGYRLPELSMGMSHDFEVAIEEGATMVRIGIHRWR